MVKGWAKAFFQLVDTRFNDKGEIVEGVDGRYGYLNERINLITWSVTQTPTHGASGFWIGDSRIVGGNTTNASEVTPDRVVTMTRNEVIDLSKRWAKTVEIFNKIKSQFYTGKVDTTEATRWKDSM